MNKIFNNNRFHKSIIIILYILLHISLLIFIKDYIYFLKYNQIFKDELFNSKAHIL